MEKSKVVLCDTNILIEFYKGNNNVLKSLEEIGQNNIVISIITAGELIYGALNKKELSIIRKDISFLTSYPLNQDICDVFIELMVKYSLSHKLSLPDAFIAATAIAKDVPLFTLNQKDFKYIKDLRMW